MCLLKTPCVIINADDFGINRDVNRAISELVTAGIVSSTSVMANMPTFSEIRPLAFRVGIGIHFNLTTGYPITNGAAIATLVTNNGSFYDVKTLFKRIASQKVSLVQIEKELSAQAERILELGVKVDHADAHESLLKHPVLAMVIYKVMRKYAIRAVRTYCPLQPVSPRHPRRMLYTCFYRLQRRLWRMNGFKAVHQYASLIQAGLKESDAIQALARLFFNLSARYVEVVVHPGLITGYDPLLGAYVDERRAEYRALMSAQFRHIRESVDYKLCRFADL